MELSNTVTPYALIREMDSDELMQYLHGLGTAQDCMGHETSAHYLNQVQRVKAQYRQLTGKELTPDTPGLTIAAAAMLWGVVGKS